MNTQGYIGDNRTVDRRSDFDAALIRPAGVPECTSIHPRPTVKTAKKQLKAARRAAATEREVRELAKRVAKRKKANHKLALATLRSIAQDTRVGAADARLRAAHILLQEG